MPRLLKGLCVALLICAGLLLARPVREACLPPLARWLESADDPDCTAYVMVLPGDEVRRPLYAAALVRLGLARDVLIPQNPESADVKDGITQPTAEISRRILIHRGIPVDRIVLLESESRTTFDDALALRGYLEGRDGNVAVVTSAFHTRRARFVFRKVLGPMAERMLVVAVPNPGFSRDDWWTNRDGMRLILTEYVKLAFYYGRYARGIWWATGGLLVVVLFGWRFRTRRQQNQIDN